MSVLGANVSVEVRLFLDPLLDGLDIGIFPVMSIYNSRLKPMRDYLKRGPVITLIIFFYQNHDYYEFFCQCANKRCVMSKLFKDNSVWGPFVICGPWAAALRALALIFDKSSTVLLTGQNSS